MLPRGGDLLESRRFNDGLFYKVLKYFALLIPFLAVAAGYGRLDVKVELNAAELATASHSMSELQQRVARVEQAVSRIPEIDKKLDEILWRVKVK